MGLWSKEDRRPLKSCRHKTIMEVVHIDSLWSNYAVQLFRGKFNLGCKNTSLLDSGTLDISDGN